VSTVRFDHVSKKFVLHRERSRSFQELFLRLLHPGRKSVKEPYWALRDVSFEVERGEMLGIIGPNGAGKSTILKLIARIIEPTSGQVEVNGTLGALLELGAGFHPDLSGRENIYLNGSLLGFGRRQMDRIFDDILDFSGMGRFVDVPVKHYSSGMYMRLGFSIAIHLRPDILLVDEVLAVGDKAFQLRCLDKINELKRRGVSILLVTHELDSVREMCDRAIWLEEGAIKLEGPVEQVLEQYMTKVFADSEQRLLSKTADGADVADSDLITDLHGATMPGRSELARRWGTREAEIVRVQLLDSQGRERRIFRTGEAFVARMRYQAHSRIEWPLFGVALHRADGFHICGPNTGFAGYEIKAIEGRGYLDYVVPSLPLLKGTYLFSATIYNHDGTHAYDHHHMAYTFRVVAGEGVQEEFGSIYIPHQWRLVCE